MVNAGWIIPATAAAIWDISSGDKRLLASGVFESTKPAVETNDDVTTVVTGSVGSVSILDVTVTIFYS